MNNETNTYPSFYVSRKHDCSYLPDNKERKIFTFLDNTDHSHIHSQLIRQGFRRSQNVLYKPNCSQCEACISIRVMVNHFNPSRSQRRVLKKNHKVIRKFTSSGISEEQYELFKRYLKYRHDDGHMQKMSINELNSMSFQPPIQSFNVDYYLSMNNGALSFYDDFAQQNLKLVGSSITDIIDDGLSMVYSYFDPEYESLSLGKYIILDHIRMAKEYSFDYVYLGYLIKQSKKMSYKASFLPQEHFVNGMWQ